MLIKTHAVFAKFYWIIPLCVVFLFLSCTQERKIVDAQESLGTMLSNASYDGKTIYEGIYQGRGPVADLIPEIRDHFKLENFVTDAQQLQEMYKIQRQIIQRIDVIDPSFFHKFEQAMRSGDHLKIRAVLKDASQITFQAVLQLPGSKEKLQALNKDNSELAQMTSELNQNLDKKNQLKVADLKEKLTSLTSENIIEPGYGGLCLVVALVAIVGVVVGVAAAVVFILAVTTPYDKSIVTADPDLIQEQLINSIALNLSN